MRIRTLTPVLSYCSSQLFNCDTLVATISVKKAT
jgi:hypothetical protein